MELYNYEQIKKLKIKTISRKKLDEEIKENKDKTEQFFSINQWRKEIEWVEKEEEYAVLHDEDSGLYEIIKIKKNQCSDFAIKHIQINLDSLFKFHPLLRQFRFNAFCQVKEFNGEEYNEDKTPAMIYNFFKRTFNWCPRQDINETIQETLNNSEYNPVVEYLESLVWDGEERISTFMQKYYNVDDEILYKKYFERWMIGLVKRIYEPGCKFDNMLVLQGEQGMCKSSLFEWLGTINNKRYCNHLPSKLNDDQTIVYATKGAFIMMNDDFDDICDKGKIGMIKEFITKRNDFAALKYLHAHSFDRHYVLCATTNSSTFLSDDKTDDERRFWVIPVKTKSKEFVLADDEYTKEQLYAEAVYKYKDNPNMKLWIWEPELVQIEMEKQKVHKSAAVDPLGDKILMIFKNKYNIPSNGEFKSEQDFKYQTAKIYDDNISENENEILGTDKYNYILRIPSSWIIRRISGIGNRSTDRIIQILHNAGINCYKKERDIYDGIQLTTINIVI